MVGKCIFCGCETSECKSVEHIIPESLGNDNSELILERGYVCDKCNNYFSTNVESHFLELEPIKKIRFKYLIPSKIR